jgi:hypothetical protein
MIPADRTICQMRAAKSSFSMEPMGSLWLMLLSTAAHMLEDKGVSITQVAE